MVSPQYIRYAAGSEKEKGAGGRLHGGTIAQLFVFCNGGVAGAPDSGVRPPMWTDGFVLACALLQRGVWLGLRPPSAGGLAWPAPSSSGGSFGLPPFPQRGVCAWPAPSHLAWPAPSFSGGSTWPFPTNPPSAVFENRGTPPVPPAGAAPPAPCLRNGGGVPREPASAAPNVANPWGGEYHTRSFFQGDLQ